MSPEQPAPQTPPLSGVANSLHTLAQQLRQAQHLGPEARQELAGLVEELGQALRAGTVPPAEAAHLADSTAHLLQALHQRQDPGLLTAARERLERAMTNAETKAPFVVGIAQRLLDALAGLGI
jgi:hypothetical protein